MGKRQKLDYNSAALAQNLQQSTGQGVDAFFPSPSPTPPANLPQEKTPPLRKAQSKPASRVNSSSVPALTTQPNQRPEEEAFAKVPIDSQPPNAVQGNNDVTMSRRHEATLDALTSSLHDINKKLWREIIEETETHNSSLRMSASEREQMEDVVRDLKRKHKIKTSMNEIARLGLLFLIHDFKKRGAQSIIADVKTS